MSYLITGKGSTLLHGFRRYRILAKGKELKNATEPFHGAIVHCHEILMSKDGISVRPSPFPPFNFKTSHSASSKEQQ
jgi:hypothetical protein